MTMPALPAQNDTNWYAHYAAVHAAAAAVTEGRLTDDALRAAFGPEGVKASAYGVTGDGSNQRAALIAALDAAEAAGGYRPVLLPAGIIDVGTGISMANRTCTLVGQGASHKGGGSTAGTVLRASSQAGPVLNLTGFKSPSSMRGKVMFRDFVIEGSGVADPTKANAGIKVDAASGIVFENILIINTGGPCLQLIPSTPGDASYMNDYVNLVLTTPVGAKANDVPYLHAKGSNGNRFLGIGFRSVVTSADVGASGAVLLEDDGTYAPEHNLFQGCWFENLHPPTNGTLVAVKGNTNILADWQFFDCSKEAGATGTSYFRLAPPSVTNYGGNIVRGYIPGADPGSAVSIDCGVDLRQSRNRIEGVKGYRGTNVIIATGVFGSSIHLGGAESAADNLAVIDNSSNAYPPNTWSDDFKSPNILRGTGSPEGVVVADAGTIYLRTDGGTGTSLYVKEVSNGWNTGWVAK